MTPPSLVVCAPGELTPRQLEVLGLVAEGLTNKQIAERLWLSSTTVKRHLQRITAVLGQSGRVRLVQEAQRRGLLPPVVPVPGADAPGPS